MNYDRQPTCPECGEPKLVCESDSEDHMPTFRVCDYDWSEFEAVIRATCGDNERLPFYML